MLQAAQWPQQLAPINNCWKRSIQARSFQKSSFQNRDWNHFLKLQRKTKAKCWHWHPQLCRHWTRMILARKLLATEWTDKTQTMRWNLQERAIKGQSYLCLRIIRRVMICSWESVKKSMSPLVRHPARTNHLKLSRLHLNHILCFQNSREKPEAN